MQRFVPVSALVGTLLLAGCSASSSPQPGNDPAGTQGGGSPTSVSSAAASCAPEVIAHRGEPAVAPEETMRSFRAASDHGARVLEGDIQFTKDGRAVMLHDATVDRTTNGTGRIKDLTFAQARSLDAGQGTQIPTLDELVSFAKERNVRLVVELKDPGIVPAQVAKILKEIKSNGMEATTTIESFSAPSLMIAKRLDPTQQTALITRLPVSGAEARASGTSVLPDITVVTKSTVQEWHAAGVKVYPWTPDTSAGWSKARLAGVDGVITNHTSDYLAWAAKGCPAP